MLLKEYKRQYLRFGNPSVFVNIVELHTQALEHLLPYSSLQLAEINKFLGHLLIDAESDLNTIQKAYEVLKKSDEAIDSLDFLNESVIEAKIQTKWLQSITFRM